MGPGERMIAVVNLKEKAKNGQKIAGTMCRVFRNPTAMLLAKHAGLDFLMFDCEHGAYDIETLHDMFLVGNAIGLPGFVRVPNLSKDYISRYLDAGASGIMVPMIETVEQAQTLVKYSKYTPVGDRGFVGCCGHTEYTPIAHSTLMSESNDRIMSIAQIETKTAVENIEGIAAVEGIDMLLIGPNDLSISLGIPGDLMNPIELDAIRKVGEAAKRHGKLFCVHAGPALQKHFADLMTVMMQLGDIEIITAGFKGVAEGCRKVFED